jgi:hypothetical protein
MSPPFEMDDSQEIQEGERDLLMSHPFEPFSLTGGSHTSVMDIKKVKIKP